MIIIRNNMNKYNQLIQENGFLTKSGEQEIKEKFLPTIKHFLDMAGSENELRIVGSVLSNIIGKEVLDMVIARADKTTRVNEPQETASPARLTDLFDNSMPIGKEVVSKLEKILQEKTDELLKMSEKFMPLDTNSDGVLDDLLWSRKPFPKKD